MPSFAASEMTWVTLATLQEGHGVTHQVPRQNGKTISFDHASCSHQTGIPWQLIVSSYLWVTHHLVSDLSEKKLGLGDQLKGALVVLTVWSTKTPPENRSPTANPSIRRLAASPGQSPPAPHPGPRPGNPGTSGGLGVQTTDQRLKTRGETRKHEGHLHQG